MHEIIKYGLYDIFRNRIVIAYSVLLLCMSLGLFVLESQPEKALLSLLNIVLIIVPLVSIIFSSIYYYNSYEFTELLIAQPIGRRTVLFGQYISVSTALIVAFFIGAGLPLLIYMPGEKGGILLLTGILLTLGFVSLAFLSAVNQRDKAKGIGLSLLIWFYFSLVYDGIVLFILFSFSDYSLETPMLVLSMLNPIDLGRIVMLMKLDTAAIMGFSGAIFRNFLGTSLGMLVSVSVLIIWIIIPLIISVKLFKRKDV